jgi:hypothetical protein
MITARVTLSSQSDNDVTKATYQLLVKTTTGTGNERRTNEHVIAERVVADPFHLGAGETKTLDLDLDYSLGNSLKDMGGVIGGLGKLAAFASSERDQYFVVAMVGVKGAAFMPSDRVQVTVK